MVTVIVSHALPVSWAANLDEIYARTHLGKNFKVPFALKLPSKLKLPQLQDFKAIVSADPLDNLDGESEVLPRFLSVFSKTYKDVAEIGSITGFKVFVDEESGEIKNFVEMWRNWND